ncbi:helix-turn-helix domain-containing protein [Saccharothrix texasensis]|uniref:Helix-turn-helix protein n=1 Tax=Saccharothrix texasensis TaxID=103734 RepID=A0A3N1H139_9PSEU|nr:helix-turn-helix transcriptional regulator [Saccharothrix texasensis]ROP36253.1 helix-turn-helix protein [Saccharothrix texasensis]
MAHGRPSYRFDGDGLRTRRETGGMSLRALAKRCEQHGYRVGDSQLSKIERGLCTPRPGLLRVLARIFNVPTEALLLSATSAA